MQSEYEVKNKMDKERWVTTNVIKKFPYLQEVDWITDDMKVVKILIMNSKDDLSGIEWETFNGGFTLKSNYKLSAPVQMRILFEDNATAAIKRLNDLVSDINPAEICSQIESDNLKNWCEIIQVEMKMAMVQLPCWGEEGKTDGRLRHLPSRHLGL